MSNKIFYVMLATAGWGDHNANMISGPDIFANEGQIVGPISEPFVFDLEITDKGAKLEDYPPQDFLRMRNGRLFSGRFIRLLHSLGVDNIEYFDTTVIHKPSGEKLEYKVGNILGVISGLDHTKSKFTYDSDGDIIDIEKMQLDENKIAGHKIFRLEESWMHIVVHKSIKEAVEAAGLTGFMFVTDDEFVPSML